MKISKVTKSSTFFFIEKNLFNLLLFLTGILFFNINSQKKEYDWDLPGYLGSCFVIDIPNDNVELQQKVYYSLQKEVTKENYQIITGFDEDNWRSFVSKDSAAFSQQIPYYSIKVFYISLIYCFHSVGFSGPDSVFMPNLISFFILGFLLFAIFKEIFKGRKILSFSITFLLLSIPSFRYLAIIPTPDMLVILLIIWLFYSILKKQKSYIQLLILLLIIFTRPDYIIFVLSYLLCYNLHNFIKNKKMNFLYIYSGIIMISFYFLILKVNHYPGWKHVFYDTFIQRRNFVEGNADFKFKEYFEVFKANIFHFKKITIFALIFAALILYFEKDSWLKFLGITVFLNIFLKFIFFPSTEPRFYVAFLLILFIISVSSTMNKIRTLTKI